MLWDFAGFFAPWLLCAWVLLLHLILPARDIEGYVSGPDGELLRYRINGMAVFVVSIGAWFVAAKLGWAPLDWLYHHRWAGLVGAVVLGLVFTFAVVLPAPATERGLMADLFLGRLKNPQWFGARVDAKMFLYLFGATVLGLNALSFAAYHRGTFADDNVGIYVYTALLFWFLLDYLTFEHVHVYTYDIFAEHVGFKLGWGCLAFYPYFYVVGVWSVADLGNPESHPALWGVAVVVFLTGWSFARGANMQKFYFKRDPGRSFLGIQPEAVSDGQRSLLCNGFWGLSRHVNYMGEILMATGLTLALGHSVGLDHPIAWVAWLYPLYYVALLVPRQFDDDRRCAAKYGPLWDEYVKRVPKRIIPFVF